MRKEIKYGLAVAGAVVAAGGGAAAYENHRTEEALKQGLPTCAELNAYMGTLTTRAQFLEIQDGGPIRCVDENDQVHQLGPIG